MARCYEFQLVHARCSTVGLKHSELSFFHLFFLPGVFIS